MLATSTANISTGVTTKHLLTVRTWTSGQHPTNLDCCMTQRKQSVSPLTDGTWGTTRNWPSRVSASTADWWTDLFYESSCGHNIGPRWYRCRDSRFLTSRPQVGRSGSPVGTDSDRDASSLLSRLGQKNQEWRREGFNSIDVSNSNFLDWIPSSRSLYSMPGGLSNIGFATSSLPACANSKLQRSGPEH